MRCKRCSKEFSDDYKFCPYCGTSATIRRRQTKRPNGSGTVFYNKRYKAKPWFVKAPATKTIDGKYENRIIGRYATKLEAIKALSEYIVNPYNVKKSSLTVESIYNDWKKTKFKNIGIKQKQAYELSFKKLTPIYNTVFKELRTADMQAIIDKLSPKYSLSALQKIKVLLGQLYQYAMQNDIVNKNYAEFIVLPKEIKKVKPCFTSDEVKRIKTAAANGVKNSDLILIMCYTGHRIGEFLSLTKADTFTDGDMMFLRGGNKTEAGMNKVVPVSPIIRPYVEKWLAKGGETIFCKDNGKPFNIKHFRESVYYPTLEALNLPKLTPHATRRTFSTRLAAAGVREEEVAKMMGHTDYGMDINAYINPENKTLFEAIKKLS